MFQNVNKQSALAVIDKDHLVFPGAGVHSFGYFGWKCIHRLLLLAMTVTLSENGDTMFHLLWQCVTGNYILHHDVIPETAVMLTFSSTSASPLGCGEPAAHKFSRTSGASSRWCEWYHN